MKGRRAKRGGARRPRRRSKPRRPWGRWAALVLVVAVAGLAAYVAVLRENPIEPRLSVPPATATIGSGGDAVPVGPRGEVLDWMEVPEGVRLPELPLSELPPRRRLAGPVREQALVLGAAPAALRPYLEGSHYGESGVGVELRSGIELRFGDSSQARAKWKAAAAVLADPSITTLDYVNLQAPRRPTVGGSGHTLPTLP